MDDLISRQAVLDYIDSMPCEVTADGHYMIRRIRLTEYISDTLPSAQLPASECWKCNCKRLPSAQSEIIRCRDCKHWDKTWTNDWSPDYH